MLKKKASWPLSVTLQGKCLSKLNLKKHCLTYMSKFAGTKTTHYAGK